MSYVDRNSANRSTRTIVLATVAGIHGLALYGLMTGLGGQYVDQVITTIKGTNIPIEPPPPPTTEPQKKVEPTDTKVTTVPNPIPDMPTIDRPVMEPTVLVPQIPVSQEKVWLPEIKPNIPSPVPSGTPRLARPRNAPSNWVTTDDYPTTELRNGVQGVVGFEVAIGADGKVEGCRITSSSGSTGLDAATCRYVTRRARFDAATDASGAKVSGTYSSKVTWVIPTD